MKNFKSLFGHNTAADCPTSVKFCVGKQYSMVIDGQSLKMGPFYRPYTTSYRLAIVSMKFGTQQQIWNSVTVTCHVISEIKRDTWEKSLIFSQPTCIRCLR